MLNEENQENPIPQPDPTPEREAAPESVYPPAVTPISEPSVREQPELRRLSDMIERLQVDRKDDQLARQVRKEIADLKEI